MSKRIGKYLRQQHLALVTMFLVLCGGTALAVSAPKNSVKSKSVKNEALKSQDLKDGKAVSGADVVDDSLKGADVDEGSLNIDKAELPGSLPPSGPAGGGLAGDYPNPVIGPDSVGGAQIIDGEVTGADVNESTLAAVPSALTAFQAGLGRQGVNGSCDPESETFVVCSTVQVTLASPARLLVIGRVRADTEFDSDVGFGQCRIGSTSGTVGDSTMDFALDDEGDFEFATDNGSLTVVTNVFPAGTHTFGVDCNQSESSGAIDYAQAQVAAVALSAG